MDLELSGKSAVVTGASRGIGKAIAAALVAEGCRVTICARGEEALTQSAQELASKGGEVHTEVVDLTSPEGAASLMAAAQARFGGVDILVNNVGGNRRGLFADTSDEDWEAVLDLNFKSHLRCSRLAIPMMRQQGGGSIIFVSSIFGREAGGPGLVIYNTTKSALISMAKIMALELAAEGIRVNCVAPGSIRFSGGSWDRRCLEDPEGMEVFIAQNLPLGRFGKAEEVAEVVTFLASERASLVTGACLNVDGGQSKSLI